MGYKSVIHSISSANNKANRESERQYKKQLRETERKQKKISSAEDKKEKILNSLEDEYAKGKIDKDKFKELKEREAGISVDYIIIGKSPYVNLSKRYVTGKITEKEYEEIMRDILPLDIFDEKESIEKEVKGIKNKMSIFRKECRVKEMNKCQKCGKEKSFFDRLKEMEGLCLCRKCRSNLNEIRSYGGFKGEYYSVYSMNLTFADIDNKEMVKVHFNSELL